MINLLRAEFFKVVRNRAFYLLNLLMVFFASFVNLLAFLDSRGVLDRIDSITVDVDEDVTYSGNEFLRLMLEMPTVLLIFFAISVLGAFFIANELDGGPLKNLVASGYARWKIYFAKLIVLTLSSLVMFIVLLASFGIIGSSLFGFGEWPAEMTGAHLMKVLTLHLLLFISITAIVMVFAIIATNSGLAFVLPLAFYLVVGSGLKTLSHHYKFGELLIEYSVFERLSFVNEYATKWSNFIETGLIAFVTFCVVTLIGLFLFQRKDIV